MVLNHAMGLVSLQSLTAIGRPVARPPAIPRQLDVGARAAAQPVVNTNASRPAQPGAVPPARPPAAVAIPADAQPRGNVVEPPLLAALIHSELVGRAKRLRTVVAQLARELGADANGDDGDATGALAQTILCADDLVGELERLAAVAASYTDAGSTQGDRVLVHELLRDIVAAVLLAAAAAPARRAAVAG